MENALEIKKGYADAIVELNDRDNAESLEKYGKLNSYDTETRQFVAFLRSGGYADVSAGLLAYAEHMTKPDAGGRRLAARTYNKRLQAAKKRVRELIDHYGARLPLEVHSALERELRRLKPKKVNNVSVRPDKFLSMDEIQEVIAGTEDRTVALLVEFLGSTGVRISEALSVLLSDVHEHGDLAHVRILGKGSKERWVYPTTDLVRRIKKHFGGTMYLFEHHGKPYSRNSMTQRVKLATLRTVGKELSAHAFRHSYATYMLFEKGLPEKKVADLLGHSSTAVTNMIYAHGTASPEEAQTPL